MYILHTSPQYKQLNKISEGMLNKEAVGKQRTCLLMTQS